MPNDAFVPHLDYQRFEEEEMLRRAARFHSEMARRRSIRDFSPEPVPRTLIETCLRTAALAPSGANMQPWHFVAVGDADLKREIRVAAEKEEREFYRRRASEEWLQALAPLGTDENKPFLEIAPWLIVVFAQLHGDDGGRKVKHYYVNESVGIATGMLITAMHHAGLVSLTHTPSPMGFLNEILGRSRNERPYLLLVVGYPAVGATVPNIARKRLQEIASFR